MTAPLVKDYSRAPLAEEFIKENIEEYFYNDADLTATTILVRSGQLWERIAEDVHNPAVITPSQYARIGEVRNELGTRQYGCGYAVTGPKAFSKAYGYNLDSNGIISAGQRYASMQPATYGLTSIDDE